MFIYPGQIRITYTLGSASCTLHDSGLGVEAGVCCFTKHLEAGCLMVFSIHEGWLLERASGGTLGWLVGSQAWTLGVVEFCYFTAQMKSPLFIIIQREIEWPMISRAECLLWQ